MASGSPTPIALISLDWDAIDLVEHCVGFELFGVFDTNPEAALDDGVHLGGDDAWPKAQIEHPELRLGLVADPPSLKARLLEIYGREALATLVSPNAYVSASATLAAGCIVQRGVTVMPKVKVGLGCKLNINATLHHEVSVAELCTLAPGAQVLGRVSLERNVYVGAGALILPNLTVGEGAVIGAGAVVTKNVAAGATVVGVPARG